MINITKIILRENLDEYKNSSIEGYSYNSKGLKAYLEMKNYTAISCKENKELLNDLDEDKNTSIKLKFPSQTLIGFVVNSKEFISYETLLKYSKEEVTSIIPEFNQIMDYVANPTNHSALECINKNYVEYLYKFDRTELVKEKVKTDRYIKVQFNGSVHNVVITATVIMHKRIIDKKYVSDRDYSSMVLNEIKSDISKDMDHNLININESDVKKYNTKDKSLILIYKLIADKEV